MLENLFVGIADWLRSLLGGLGTPVEINEAIVMLVKLVAILVFILIIVLLIVLLVMIV